MTGSISESMAYMGQSITLTGGGTLYLDATNSYTGSTTVNDGSTLVVGYTTASTLGIGSSPLAINGTGSTVTLYNSASISNLSGTGGGTLNLVNAETLTVNQTSSTQFIGTLLLASGANLAVTSSNSSTLQLNVTSSNRRLGATATVYTGATLQLSGTVSALANFDGSDAANIVTHGTGTLLIAGGTGPNPISTQTVGTISGDSGLSGGATVYSGNTVVGDGTYADNLTATQILQNSLTINAGSTVTIAPAGDPSGNSGATPCHVRRRLPLSSAATADSNTDSSGADTDPFTAIQSAIATGAISSTTGRVLEYRIAAIERLAATDPGLDVSLLESRVLAVLPTSSSIGDAAPALDTGSNLLALDSSALGSVSGQAAIGSTAFAPSASFAGSPAAVPEPSTLVLAALAVIGLLFAVRRRSVHCE